MMDLKRCGIRKTAILGSTSRLWIDYWTTAFVLVAMTTEWFRGHVQGLSLAPIYWNTSNPLFKQSSKDHVIQVQPRDDIDFVCPYYVNSSDENPLNEFYVIYQVSKAEYDNCAISRTVETSSFVLLNCSSPSSKRRFTVIFDQFQAIPNIPEYLPGQVYYYICELATSSGSLDGIGSLVSGSCANNNMKLAVYVCCRTDPPPSILSTTVSLTTLPSATTWNSVRDTTTIRSVWPNTPSSIPVDAARPLPTIRPINSNNASISTKPTDSSSKLNVATTSGEQRRSTTGVVGASAQRLTNSAVAIKPPSPTQFLLFYSCFLVINILSIYYLHRVACNR